MGETAFTILVEGVRTLPGWAKRICSEFQLVLIDSDEVIEAVKAELAPTLNSRRMLAEQVRWIGERSPKLEAKYLRKRGVGRVPVMFVNGVSWVEHLDHVAGCIIDVTSYTISNRPVHPLDDRQVILSCQAEARRYARRLVAVHLPRWRICYLPTRWSQDRKYARALSALKKWGLPFAGRHI